MLQRVITASILLAVILGCTLQGGLFLWGLLIVITGLSSYELGKMLFSSKTHVILATLINVLLLLLYPKFEFLWTHYVTYIILAISWILFYVELKSKSMSRSIVLGYFKSIILISFSFPYIMLILSKSHGLFLLLLLCITIWLCDTFCLLVGKQIGSRHLSIASPNKTIEGSAGGVIGSVACTWLFLWTQNQFYYPLIMLPFIMSIVSQIGDLYESHLKRRADIKDSSTLLPGHGGILDRTDSFLIGLPMYYILLSILGL